MNPRMTLGVNLALAKVKAGASVRQAAAECGVWPQSIYAALKRDGTPAPSRQAKPKPKE